MLLCERVKARNFEVKQKVTLICVVCLTCLVCKVKMWFLGWKGPSGFSAASTAEQVTQGIDGTALTAIVTGFSSLPMPFLFWVKGNILYVLLGAEKTGVCVCTKSFST